jgi:hypothetical protein
MTAKDYIELKQKEWAKRNITLGNDKRYAKTYTENLFKSLDKEIKEQFKNADGGELNGEECKMAALYSSSALGVNVFQYFYKLLEQGNKEEANKILYALGVSRDKDIEIKSISFEQKLHIGNISTPNIDIIITTTNNKVFAIESKFREPYYYTPSNYIQKKYYDNNDIWNKLEKTKEYIDELDEGFIEIEKDIIERETSIEEKEIGVKKIFPSFKRLNAAQLIKHLLGLFNDNKSIKEYKNNIRLIYLYYDVPGNMGEEHRKEIKEFSDFIKKDNIKFTAISYQELIYNLNNLLDRRNKEHKKYLDYINSRYL